MKTKLKIMLVVALLNGATSMTGAASDGTINVPDAVKATVRRLYPSAKGVTYEKEHGDYEASFRHEGKAMSVLLNRQGVVKETETAIAVEALPAACRTYIARQLPGRKIKEAAEIIDARGGKTYEAEVGGKDLMFNASGERLH